MLHFLLSGSVHVRRTTELDPEVVFVWFLLGLFWRIWHMDLVQSAVLYAVMTLVSTYLVAFAYKNVKFVLKHK